MADHKDEHVVLTPSMIPKECNFDVKDSSFFQTWSELPSPEMVQAQARTQNFEDNPENSKQFPMDIPPDRPPPVIFKEMGVFVKWGSAVNLSEAWALYAINRLLKGRVPVPEVYGWRTHGEQRFIYMEHVQGQTLEQAWENMEDTDRAAICCELRTICDNLRRLEQHPSDKFVGNIVRAPLYDRAIHLNSMSEAGPFATVQEFHDWFTFLYRKPMPDPYSFPLEPFRYDLPDDCAIKFTHGDLHRSNIIVTPGRPYRTLAIIDWEQSGWLPAYWEVRKAQYTADRLEEWSTKYLPIILDQYTTTWEPWDYYTISMGC